MNEIVATIVRAVGAAAGGFLLQRGLLPEGTSVDAFAGSFLVAAAGIWGIIQKRIAAKKLEKAIAAPEGKAA